MNERIKELYLQAHEQHYSNNMAWEEVNYEKFAELIVRECMEQVYYGREEVLNGNVSHVIKARMKQHFGVEE